MNKAELKERIINETERYKKEIKESASNTISEEEIDDALSVVVDGIINVYEEDPDSFIKGLIEFNITKKVSDFING